MTPWFLVLMTMILLLLHVEGIRVREATEREAEEILSDEAVLPKEDETNEEQQEQKRHLEDLVHQLQESSKQLDEQLERLRLLHEQQTQPEEGEEELVFDVVTSQEEPSDTGEQGERMESPPHQQHPEEPLEDSSSTISYTDKRGGALQQDEHGIWKMKSHRSFPLVLQQSSDHPPHGLLLALIHSSDTASCSTQVQDKWVTKIQQAALEVQHYLDMATEMIQFGILDTHRSSKDAAEWLSNVGVDTSPTLVFVVARNFDYDGSNSNHSNKAATATSQAFLLDYIGPLETAHDVSHTVLQYYLRLFCTSTTPNDYRPFAQLPDDFAAQIVPLQLQNMPHLQTVWQTELWRLVRPIAASVRHLPGGVSPRWGREDYSYIQWLLTTQQSQPSEQQSQNHSHQQVQLLVQCQSPTHDPILLDLYTSFAELAWVLSSRRDTWFLAIENCHDFYKNKHGEQQEEGRLWLLQPGQVAVYSFPLESLSKRDESTPPPFVLTTKSPIDHDDDDDDPVATAKHNLRRFLIRQATPSVLWFDRYATAPIAFADDYTVHFLLFINVHPNLDHELDRYDPALQQVVQAFHDACGQQQEEHSSFAICLLVPSTETRILTTLGIDFWTPLDRQATATDEPNDNVVVAPSFPTLLITDRRPLKHTYRDGTTTTTHGVRRYRLQPPEVLNEGAVRQFTQDFWNNQLTPELKSQTPTPERNVNSYGVITLTAVEFQQRFQQQQQPALQQQEQQQQVQQEHALVLFTSPTCGHCKRFHATVFYRVAQLVRDLRWDAHMALYKMDVTQNEVHNMRLPDVYYFPPPNTNAAPIRYDAEDDFHNGVGRLRDPLELLEWWLDVMIGGKDWGGAGAAAMDPDVLLDILDDKDLVVAEEGEEEPPPVPPEQAEQEHQQPEQVVEEREQPHAPQDSQEEANTARAEGES